MTRALSILASAAVRLALAAVAILGILVLLVGVVLALFSGPSPEEEMASIGEVAIAYGASEGPEACDFLSASLLDQLGGESGCTSSFEGAPAAEFDVLEVTVEEETATARVENLEPNGTEFDLEFVKEGDEWKISLFPGLEQIAPPTDGAPTDELLAPPGEGGLAPPGPEAPPPAGETTP